MNCNENNNKRNRVVNSVFVIITILLQIFSPGTFTKTGDISIVKVENIIISKSKSKAPTIKFSQALHFAYLKTLFNFAVAEHLFQSRSSCSLLHETLLALNKSETNNRATSAIVILRCIPQKNSEDHLI
jgi:hypothetical protein